jgi:hypothetical protein
VQFHEHKAKDITRAEGVGGNIDVAVFPGVGETPPLLLEVPLVAIRWAAPADHFQRGIEVHQRLGPR